MNILLEDINNEKTLLTAIPCFCREYSAGKALKKANAYKSKRISEIQIFMYLLQLVYTEKSNVYEYFEQNMMLGLKEMSYIGFLIHHL